jgi:transcriptional regulator with XRE-family HTH domain
MKDRILAFLQNENKSYAQFAEEIGVQPSGISHILSGRNNPSLDFVIKMLHRYPSLSSEWLLFGRGSMYKSEYQATLFEGESMVSGQEDRQEEEKEYPRVKPEIRQDKPEEGKYEDYTRDEIQDNTGRKLISVLFFYSDKTFSEYRPS